ncbi:Long_chain fatty acid CoA ligase [Hexamita inflata]|uniref:Long chain fatty acid CoA ligase n=1 Tax=Hexamita inflata TaxID=28002 RepID=A0AA86UWG6_9EUKA|nr:Long chain fatty acid CoA ligase [Hexamita inflata]
MCYHRIIYERVFTQIIYQIILIILIIYLYTPNYVSNIKKTCKAHNLRSFEIPKAVVIENEPWTPENGLLTPALKVKRPACKEKYEKLMLDIIKRITRLEGATMDKIAAEVVDALTNPQSESVSQKASSYSGMR